jgi:hypothetical protein
VAFLIRGCIFVCRGAPASHAAAGSNDSGLLGRRPKPADADSSRSAGDAAAGDYSWTAARIEAFEPYPLADVAIGQEHALAVTQQVSWAVCYVTLLMLNTCSHSLLVVHCYVWFGVDALVLFKVLELLGLFMRVRVSACCCDLSSHHGVPMCSDACVSAYMALLE